MEEMQKHNRNPQALKVVASAFHFEGTLDEGSFGVDPPIYTRINRKP